MRLAQLGVVGPAAIDVLPPRLVQTLEQAIGEQQVVRGEKIIRRNDGPVELANEAQDHTGAVGGDREGDPKGGAHEAARVGKTDPFGAVSNSGRRDLPGCVSTVALSSRGASLGCRHGHARNGRSLSIPRIGA